MADDKTPAPEPEDAAAPEPPARPQPSAAATAASRARRIGGRVTPAGPTPDKPTPAPEPATAAAEPAQPEADTAAKRSRLSFRKAAAAPAADGDRAEADSPVDPDPAVDADTKTDVATDDGVAATEGTVGPPPEVPVWLRWTPAAVLTAGVITMAVLLTVFSHGVWWGRPSGNAVREEMLAAAKTCVARTNTYKYTALAAYATAAHQCTTGELTVQLDKTIKTIIKQYAPTLKATQTAQISRGALEAVSPHGKQWTVLVFGQLTVVNTNEPKGRTDPFAAQVRMEKVHGKWLMSGLKTVATPVS